MVSEVLGFDVLLWKDGVVGQENSIPERRLKPNSSSRLTLLLLMLGVCVFLWGFSYKISLYNLNERSLHTVPDAKLLSKNEDRQAADGVQQVLLKVASAQPVLLVEFVAIAFALVDACAARCYFDENHFADLKPRIATYTPSLYFRPPPIQSAL